MARQLSRDPIVQVWSQLAFEVAELACFSIGSDGTCEWSSEARRLLGLRAGEEPRTWDEFAQRFLSAPTALRMNLGEAIDLMVPMEAVEHRVRLMLRPVEDGSGRMAAVLHDRTITEQREAELMRASEWRERLQQLGRWSLLGEMASGLAHELNQPLAAISTFAQAGERLLNLPQPRIEKAATLFHEVSEQALRAGDVIHRMRGLVKRQGSESQVLTCVAILADFQALAAPIARAHHVRLDVDMPSEDLQVNVDPSHIQQILMSLFRNALDAMLDTPASERVVRATASISNTMVDISIHDSGTGITESVARELFRPFFSTKPEGTGLGLAVCRSIVGEYGGTLRFENAERGARFIIALPLAASEPLAAR